MAEKQFLSEETKAKWAPVIDSPDAPKISDPYKKKVTTIMLENTLRELRNAPRVESGLLTEAEGAGVAANYAGAFPTSELTGI